MECAECGARLGQADRRLRRGGREWHLDCFQCRHCSASLLGQSFSWREDRPYCLDCVTKLFSKSCQRCPQPIRNVLLRPDLSFRRSFQSPEEEDSSLLMGGSGTTPAFSALCARSVWWTEDSSTEDTTSPARSVQERTNITIIFLHFILRKYQQYLSLCP